MTTSGKKSGRALPGKQTAAWEEEARVAAEFAVLVDRKLADWRAKNEKLIAARTARKPKQQPNPLAKFTEQELLDECRERRRRREHRAAPVPGECLIPGYVVPALTLAGNPALDTEHHGECSVIRLAGMLDGDRKVWRATAEARRKATRKLATGYRQFGGGDAA